MSYRAIILAAGNSSRMGMPKWSLRMPSGETFAGHLVANYKKYGIDAIIVVGKDQQMAFAALLPSVDIAPNPDPAKGRMFSLQCGLKMAGDTLGVFIHNIDNPFVSGETVFPMISALESFDFVVPVYNNLGGHPVLIGRKLMDEILNLAPPFPVLRDFLSGYKSIRLHLTDKQILLNVNTHEDYRRFVAGE